MCKMLTLLLLMSRTYGIDRPLSVENKTLLIIAHQIFMHHVYVFDSVCIKCVLCSFKVHEPKISSVPHSFHVISTARSLQLAAR